MKNWMYCYLFGFFLVIPTHMVQAQDTAQTSPQTKSDGSNPESLPEPSYQTNSAPPTQQPSPETGTLAYPEPYSQPYSQPYYPAHPQPYYPPYQTAPGSQQPSQGYAPLVVEPSPIETQVHVTEKPKRKKSFPIQFGIGGFLQSRYLWNGQGREFNQSGYGGQLLLRVHRRITLELGAAYYGSYDYFPNQGATYTNYLEEVPVLGGFRVYLGHLGTPYHAALLPYISVLGGGTFSWLHSNHSGIEYTFALEGQAGVGLELHLGRHFAFNVDLRALGNVKVRDLSHHASFSPQGRGGLGLNGGLAAYF